MFGLEFYYRGGIQSDSPGCTTFGTPTNAISLGETHIPPGSSDSADIVDFWTTQFYFSQMFSTSLFRTLHLDLLQPPTSEYHFLSRTYYSYLFQHLLQIVMKRYSLPCSGDNLWFCREGAHILSQVTPLLPV